MNETISYEQACATLAANAYAFGAIATKLNCEQNPESILDAIADLINRNGEPVDLENTYGSKSQELLKELAIAKKTIKILLDKLPD